MNFLGKKLSQPLVGIYTVTLSTLLAERLQFQSPSWRNWKQHPIPMWNMRMVEAFLLQAFCTESFQTCYQRCCNKIYTWPYCRIKSRDMMYTCKQRVYGKCTQYTLLQCVYSTREKMLYRVSCDMSYMYTACTRTLVYSVYTHHVRRCFTACHVTCTQRVLVHYCSLQCVNPPWKKIPYPVTWHDMSTQYVLVHKFTLYTRHVRRCCTACHVAWLFPHRSHVTGGGQHQ